MQARSRLRAVLSAFGFGELMGIFHGVQMKPGFVGAVRLCRSAAEMLSRRRPFPQSRLIAGMSVAALHALVALVLFSSLTQEPPMERAEELRVTLSPATQRAEADVPVMPDLSVPVPVVEPPQLVIQAEEGSLMAVLASASMILAPRQDPAHPNPLPTLPGPESPVEVLVLRVLVLPTGSIGAATVLRSSGKPDDDAKAVEFVKANWRFLPAMLQDRAVEYWTVVSIGI